MSSYRIALPPLAFALAIALGGPAAHAQVDITVDDSETLVTSPSTVAPNQLANPQFDSDLAGWTKSPGTTSDFAWVANDSGGNPRSGAVRITNNSPAAAGPLFAQCFPVSPGKTYVVGGSAWVATGAPAGGEAAVILWFYPTANCSGGITESYSDVTKVAGSWKSIATMGLAPPGTVSAQAVFSPGKTIATPTPLTVYFDKLYFREGKCAGTAASLCLNGERFRVRASWKTPDGVSGVGGPVPFTADSASFWFFDPSNIELNVKVLDACSFNGRYWVFASGSTNVEVTLTVTDTQTGAVKTYKNPQGQLFATIGDVNAFATCP